VPWATAEPEGLRLEAKRDFAGALLLYNSVGSDPANQGAVLGSCARVHFALGNTGSAIDCARRALAADASRVETRVVLAKALLARGDHAEALAQAEQLVSLSGGDATHHYLCGKALFALRRLDEARRAFDVACSLQPTLLEAMLLRREVDRCIVDGGKRVGSQGPIAFEIPATLTELRDVLISGRTNDAIAALSEPRFADDPDAQLVLARMLAFDGQLERAAKIYDRVSVMPDPHRWSALVGKAALLVDLGNLESALALFDILRAERPSDLDVAEGRARVLAELGRTDEAAAEYRHFVALATSRSDLRVRAAQLWLEHHQGLLGEARPMV